MIVELKGAQFVNQGAYLMVRAVIDRLSTVEPSIRFAVNPGPFVRQEDLDRHKILSRLSLRKRSLDFNSLTYHWPDQLSEFLGKLSIVPESKVDAVFDISGYVYGGRWGDAPLRSTADHLNRCALSGRPYFFFPQCFGPFTPMSKAAVQFGQALSSAEMIMARDEVSRQAIASVANRDYPILLTPDVTIGVPGDLASALRYGIDRRSVILIPNIRMVDHGPAQATTVDSYLNFFVQMALFAQRRGLQPIIINHCGLEDRLLGERLVSMGRSSGILIRLVEERDPLQTKGLIGAAGLVISSRFHGCVNALSQGVPCLATSWAHKYESLFSDFGVDGFIVSISDLKIAEEKFHEIIDRRSDLQLQLKTLSDRQAARVEEMWSEVLSRLRLRRVPANSSIN